MEAIHDKFTSKFDQLDERHAERLENLQNDLEDAKTDIQRKKAIDKIKALNAKHKQDLNKLQTQYKESLKVQREKLNARKEIEFHNSEVDRKAKEMKKRFEYEQKRHTDMVDQYRQSLEMHQSLYDQKSKEAQMLQKQIQQFMSDQDNVFHRYKEQKLKLIELQVQLKQLNYDREEDREQISRLNQENTKVVRKLHEYKRMKEELENKINDHIREREEKKNDLVIVEQNLLHAKSDVLQHRNRAKALESSLNELRANMVSAEEAKVMLEQKYERLMERSAQKLNDFKRRLEEQSATMVDRTMLDELKKKYQHQHEFEKNLLQDMVGKVNDRMNQNQRRLTENNPRLQAMIESCQRKNMAYEKDVLRLKAIIRQQDQDLKQLRRIHNDCKTRIAGHQEATRSKEKLLKRFKQLLGQFIKLRQIVQQQKDVPCVTSTRQYMNIISTNASVEKTAAQNLRKQVQKINEIIKRYQTAVRENETSMYESQNSEKLSIRAQDVKQFQQRQQDLLQEKTKLEEKLNEFKTKRAKLIDSLNVHLKRLQNLKYIQATTAENEKQIRKNNQFIQKALKGNNWKSQVMDKNIRKLSQLIDLSQDLVNNDNDQDTPESIAIANGEQQVVLEAQQDVLVSQLRSFANDQRELESRLAETKTISEKAKMYMDFVNDPVTSNVDRQELSDILSHSYDMYSTNESDTDSEFDDDNDDDMKMLENKLQEEEKRNASLRAMVQNMPLTASTSSVRQKRKSTAQHKPKTRTRRSRKRKEKKRKSHEEEDLYSIGRIHHFLANKPAIQSKVAREPIVRETNHAKTNFHTLRSGGHSKYAEKVYKCKNFQNSVPCQTYKEVRKVHRADRLQRAKVVKTSLRRMERIADTGASLRRRSLLSDEDKIRLTQLLDEQRTLSRDDNADFMRSLQMKAFEEKIDRQYKDRVQAERDSIFREAKLIREKLKKAPTVELLSQYQSLLRNGESLTLHRQILLNEQIEDAKEWQSYLRESRQKSAAILENLNQTLQEFPDPNGYIRSMADDQKILEATEHENKTKYSALLNELKGVEDELRLIQQECVSVSRPEYFDNETEQEQPNQIDEPVGQEIAIDDYDVTSHHEQEEKDVEHQGQN